MFWRGFALNQIVEQIVEQMVEQIVEQIVAPIVVVLNNPPSAPQLLHAKRRHHRIIH
jgi:hypothetical protein